MTFKHGIDWDWENSLRKNEIDEALHLGPIMRPLMENERIEDWPAMEKLRKLKMIVSTINQFKPKSVKPFWLRRHSLDYGDTEERGESISVGVMMTETMSNSTEDSISLGFMLDLFSVDASLKETHSTTISNECSYSSTKSFKKTYVHNDEEKKDCRKIYYQLYVTITYEDGEKRDLGTSNIVAVYTPNNVNEEDEKPKQNAEKAWKSMQS